MQWFNLLPILQRHTAPTSTLRYYPPRRVGPQEMMTICDFDLPRRKGFIYTANEREDDWFAQSQVLNCCWDNGEIPLYGWKGGTTFEDNPLGGKREVLRQAPARGARQVVQMLLNEGCLVPGEELDRVFNLDSRGEAVEEYKGRYVYE